MWAGFCYSIGGYCMKFNSKFVFVLIFVLVFSCLLTTSFCAASPEVSESAPATSETTSEAPTQVPETPKDNSTKQWIFFGITSVLSLALAIPLAIRSGNKKYGK